MHKRLWFGTPSSRFRCIDLNPKKNADNSEIKIAQGSGSKESFK